MSRAPSKPPAKKAPDIDAGVPKPTPRKRAPKCAVAVKTGVAKASPAKPRKDTRKAMLDAQKALHEALDRQEKPSQRTWEETHFPYDDPDYRAENARNRQDAMDTWITVVTVFGVIIIIGIMAWWVV